MKCCGFCETHGRDLLISRHACLGNQCTPTSMLARLFITSSTLPLAVSYQLLNYFPGSRDAALAGALLELWSAKTKSGTLEAVQSPGWVPAALQLDWLHWVNANLQEHPCSWWYPALLGDLVVPQRQADRQHHPPPCSPAIIGWACQGCPGGGPAPAPSPRPGREAAEPYQPAQIPLNTPQH